MSGWKTWAAGIGMILFGLGMVGKGIAADPVSQDDIKAGAESVLAGLAILGIGHKIEKSGVN